MKVLIIEQEKILQRSLEHFMEQYKNIDVCLAHTMREGVLLWQSDSFDMILCADRLPDGNGFEMLRSFLKEKPEMLAILMTTHRDELLRQEASRAGIRGYLEKPFDLRQLEEAMEIGK